MNERLHPLTLGEILDRTANLYRSRFLVYAGIAAVPAATMLLAFGTVALLLVSTGSAVTSRGVAIAAVALLVALGVLLLPLWAGAIALGWAAMSEAAARHFLGGTITIRSAYRSAWAHRGRYLGLCLLMGLMVAAVPAAAFIVFAMLPGAGAARLSGGGALAAGALAGVALFLAIAGSVAFVLWMLLRVCLAFAACAVEQISPWNAIKRSALLSRGTKGRIFVLLLLGTALSWVLMMALVFPLMLAIEVIPQWTGRQHAVAFGVISTIVIYGLMFAVQALVRPVYGIALSIFYFDQRIRTEGFDIEWMMREAGLAQEPAQQAQGVPWLAGVTPAALPEMPETNAPLASPFDPEPPKAGGLA